MNATKPTTCALYARKSTLDRRTANDGNSVERQLTLGREFAQRHGWSVVAEESDAEVSGAEFHDRPGFARLLEGAERRRFSVVVTMALSRIGRDQVGVMNALTRMHEAGVGVWVYQTGQEIRMDTPNDILVASVTAFGDADARHKVKLSTSEGLVAIHSRGHSTGAKTLGFVSVFVGTPATATTKRVGHFEKRIDPAEAATVVRIFTMFADGDGLLKIAKALRADGVPAPRKSKAGWSKKIIAGTLSNTAYIGECIFQKTKSVDRAGKAGRRVAVPRAEWKTHTNPDLRVVDPGLWERVQARRRTSASAYLRDVASGKLSGKPEGLGDLHLLNSVGRCHLCNGPLSLGRKYRTSNVALSGFMPATWHPPLVLPRGEARSRYHCSASRHRGSCVGVSIPAAALEDEVLASLRDTLDPKVLADIMEQRVSELRAQHAQRLAAHAVESVDHAPEIQKLEAEIGRLVNLAAEGTAAPDVMAGISQRRARIETLRAQPVPEPEWWQEADDDLGAPRRGTWDRATFMEGCRTASGWFAAPLLGDVRLARQAMRRMGVDRIVVTPDGDGAWSFTGFANLGHLVVPNGTSGGPSRPPIN